MGTNITKVNVTQVLYELDGETPVTNRDTCPGCFEVYRKIHGLLLPGARDELSSHESEISDIVTKESEQITPRLAINRALLTAMKDDELKAETLVARLNLAERIYENDEVEISHKEALVILDRVPKMYQALPIVSAQICRLVDPTMREQKL